VIIVCMSAAAAGHVVLLLLRRSLFPRTHFRIEQTERDTITISVVISTLRATEATQLRTDLAAIADVCIQEPGVTGALQERTT
jgi:hypothetical protein